MPIRFVTAVVIADQSRSPAVVNPRTKTDRNLPHSPIGFLAAQYNFQIGY